MIDCYGTFKGAAAVCEEVGLTLVPTEGCTQPYTVMETREIIVEPLNPHWPNGRVLKWLGEIYHEIGHHVCGDLLPVMEKYNISMDTLLGKLVNAVEDYRQERHGLGELPGRDEAISWTQAYYCARGAISLKDAELDKDMRLVVDVMSWLYTRRSEWCPDLVVPAMDFAEYAVSYYHGLDADLDAMASAEDMYQVVLKILDSSESHDTEEEKQKSAKAKQEAEESEEGEGSGKGDDGEGDADGDPSETGSVSYKDIMGHVHSEGSKSEYQTDITYDHTPASYTPNTKMRVRKARDCGYSESASPRAMAMYKDGVKLSNKAKRLFQARTQSLTTHYHKAGRLDKRDLYRIPAGARDVFKRKEVAATPEGTALFILTDASASMHRLKYEATAAAVALLNDAVQPLGVPTMIAAFTERFSQGTDHYIIKEFNEKRSAERILIDYDRMESELYQNADGESVMWAYKLLSRRPEPRKILLVLSDGMPCADNPGDCATYTKDVVKYVSSKVECYGIGILTESVKHFYPEYSVLKDINELEGCLLEVIKSKIF